jgi:2-polyprenyl-3-methyl-5-hydroxy-6-metoxy-1,4-benzoquinol methylase
LGLASAWSLSGADRSGELDIVLLHGPLYRDKKSIVHDAGTSCRVLENIPNLGEHLAEYDLIITHYGITAFEALYAGAPVLLVSPGAYHEKLANNAGFLSAGIGMKGAAGIGKLLFIKAAEQSSTEKNGSEKTDAAQNIAGQNKTAKTGTLALNQPFLQNLTARCAEIRTRYKLDREPKQNLAALINRFTLIPNRNCPSCGAAGAQPPIKPLARFPHRSYYRCPHCGLIYMKRLTPPPIEYEKEYFFDFYKKQYGKTYIEDFPNLMAMGKQRLRIIKTLLPGGNIENIQGTNAAPNGAGRLLDIGCAYGPFLAAAKEEGFNPLGIDPAEDAVRYIHGELKLEARQGFFPNTPLPELIRDELFDVVTLWYVIEHFSECPAVLHEIRRVLKPGGVLAFSTPSFSGVSGRKSLKTFLEQSPRDHWTIWSPVVCKRRLKAAGFKVKKIVLSGHHPERFPLIGKYIKTKKGLLYAALTLTSKMFGLGDTFEAYAIALPMRNSGGEGGGKK